MKNILMIVMIVLSSSVFGQSEDLRVENGKFYNLSGSLFTGTYFQYEGNTKISEFSVEEGVLSGSAMYFHANGKVKEEGNYTNGVRNGNWSQYNDMGELTSIASFKADKKHGKWMVWDENGNKRFEMYYNEGVKIGTWKIWDAEGNLTTKSFN